MSSDDKATEALSQLSDLAKRIQGASSFQSIELANQMSELANEVQKSHQDLVTAASAQNTETFQRTVEEMQRAVELAARAPQAAVTEQMASIQRKLEEQQVHQFKKLTDELLESVRQLGKVGGSGT